ncbi:hypothetical protein Tco_1245729 [Tanacetum coccineum]
MGHNMQQTAHPGGIFHPEEVGKVGPRTKALENLANFLQKNEFMTLKKTYGYPKQNLIYYEHMLSKVNLLLKLSVTPLNSLQRKTGFGIVTSWREEDLIREIDLYMPIYQCRLLIFWAATAAVACCETYCFDTGLPITSFLPTTRVVPLFDDSCAVRDDLRKAYEKCNDISQESRALICMFLKKSSEKDRKLHLSMYGKATKLEKQMDAKLAWFQEKYSCRTHRGVGCSSSQADFPLTNKELHQLRIDEEALRETLEEEAMNKKAQEERIRQEQAENDAFFLEFGVVRYDSEYESSD